MPSCATPSRSSSISLPTGAFSAVLGNHLIPFCSGVSFTAHTPNRTLTLLLVHILCENPRSWDTECMGLVLVWLSQSWMQDLPTLYVILEHVYRVSSVLLLHCCKFPWSLWPMFPWIAASRIVPSVSGSNDVWRISFVLEKPAMTSFNSSQCRVACESLIFLMLSKLLHDISNVFPFGIWCIWTFILAMFSRIKWIGRLYVVNYHRILHH